MLRLVLLHALAAGVTLAFVEGRSRRSRLCINFRLHGPSDERPFFGFYMQRYIEH